MSLGLIDQPLEWLLFSDFAVILAFVHLYTLFMVVPIFNTMMRIDKSPDRGGARRRRLRLPDPDQRHHPADQAGHHDRHDLRRDAGDGRLHHRAVHVRQRSRANVGRLISNDIGLLQYPSAAATAVVLLATVLIMIAIMLRFVDIRKEL